MSDSEQETSNSERETSDSERDVDRWPNLLDAIKGEELDAIKKQESPLRKYLLAKLLVNEVYDNLDSTITLISKIKRGRNGYGLFIELSDGTKIVARLGRQDVNMPGYQGPPLLRIADDVRFEAALYRLTSRVPAIKTSVLLYHRAPKSTNDSGSTEPSSTTIQGRKLLVHVRAKHCGYDPLLSFERDQMIELVTQAARVRAALYLMPVSASFAFAWLPRRLFTPTRHSLPPQSLRYHIFPDRNFCLNLLRSRIQQLIGEPGDMIGLPEAEEVVGPVATAAKTSLLKLLPLILPDGEGTHSLYRFVVEHEKFSVHNMTFDFGADHMPEITSVWGWGDSRLVPALFSNPRLTVCDDLDVDAQGEPVIAGSLWYEPIEDEDVWLDHYYKTLFELAPDYKAVIKAATNARYLWSKLEAWTSAGSENYFGRLGRWAEQRYAELADDDDTATLVG